MRFFEFELGKVYKFNELLYRRVVTGHIQYQAPNGEWNDTEIAPMTLYSIDFIEVDELKEEFERLSKGVEVGNLYIALDTDWYDVFVSGKNRNIYYELVDFDDYQGAISLEDMESMIKFVDQVKALAQKIDKSVDKNNE